LKQFNHYCDELKAFIGDAKYTFYTIQEKDGVWYLTIKELAREITVSMGEADNVGDIMSEYEFRIRFCPFCGQFLNK